MKSPLSSSLEKKIITRLDGLALSTARLLIADPEVEHLQDYANTVSIKRLNYNDHGPVHMRKVTLNVLSMLDLLHAAGIQLSLEKEESGTFEDSKVALLLAAFLHDVGMTMGRTNHEQYSAFISLPIMDRILAEIYPDNHAKRVIVRSTALEAIVGHMATQKISSIEAGIMLIADGCDMEKGRSRIPLMMNTESKVGDIHKYSSAEIRKVSIDKGNRKPIRITVEMAESVGFFQVEEVLFTKINSSTIKQYVELYAGVTGKELKKYL